MKVEQDFESYLTFAKFNFFVQGIACLIAWNSILTVLDFFGDKFPDYNDSFLIPIPNFVSTNICALSMHWISSKLTVNQRIIGGHTGMIVLMIILPFIAIGLSKTVIGFWVSMFTIFILGFFNSLSQTSCFGLAAMFPHDFPSILLAGTGTAGIIVSCLRMLLLGTMSQMENSINYSTLVFFFVSALYLVFAMSVHIKFVKTPFARYYLNFYHKTSAVLLNETDNHLTDEELNEDLMNPKKSLIFQKTPEFLEVFKKSAVSIFFIWLIYVVTFMNFPGLAMSRKLAFMNDAWSPTFLVLIYNIGDTISKYLAKYRFYNKNGAIFLVLVRTAFFYIFIGRALQSDSFAENDIVLVIGVFLFAFTNGLGTSMLMTLAPEDVEDYEREDSGFFCTFALLFGITSGLFLALPFQNFGK